MEPLFNHICFRGKKLLITSYLKAWGEWLVSNRHQYHATWYHKRRNLPNGSLLLSAAVSAFQAGLFTKLEIEAGNIQLTQLSLLLDLHSIHWVIKVPFNFFYQNVVMKERSCFICPPNNCYFLDTGSFLSHVSQYRVFGVVLAGVVTMDAMMAW